MSLFRLTNQIQEYAWGSARAIPELLGIPNPRNVPMAELWMGAHERAPSSISSASSAAIPLDQAIAQHPELLGEKTAAAFSGKLPFLFKILAADRPLSIQAHPNLKQAQEGFARENAAGIPVTAPNRNYRDANHKPEIICAVSEFFALCGFRKIPVITTALADLCPATLKQPCADLTRTQDLRSFFTGLLQLPAEQRLATTQEAVNRAKGRREPEAEWLLKAQSVYPGDIGILAPYILNLVQLHPGEALYTGAGVLHAYLQGLGIELMANSDNVLRGGLTPKHIDIPELLRIGQFRATSADLVATQKNGAETQYRTPAKEFILSRIEISETQSWDDRTRRETGGSLDIFICLDGRGELAAHQEKESFKRGDSLLVGADTPTCKITGTATLYRATIPCPQ